MINRSSMHTMRQMNSMMNSMFHNPFEMMGQNALMLHHGRGASQNDMSVSLFDPHFGRFGFVSIILDIKLTFTIG